MRARRNVAEHVLLAQSLEVALTIIQDQVRGLVAFESFGRRCQVGEIAYEGMLRKVDAGLAGGDDWISERSIFFCLRDFRSGATARPEREDCVAMEMAAWAAVLKERRKAHEEAARSKSSEPQAAPTATAEEDAQSSKGDRG